MRSVTSGTTTPHLPRSLLHLSHGRGVIGTIQWEGYREAVDDMRYIATLHKAIERARNAKTTAGVAADAARWLEGVDPPGDLDAIRQQAAEWITRLSAQR